MVLNATTKPDGRAYGPGAVDGESETTPLLASSHVAPTQDPDIAEALISTEVPESTPNPEDKPLPRVQIFLLCYARIVEPMAFFSIFPYINQMLEFNGNLPDTDVGFYSGLIESLFSVTQMLVMIMWSRASDRIGRKPVLVFSLAGVSVATAMFGMATTIWQMILFRCIAGVFAGTIVTIRTMISEHSTHKTQARSFSLFAFAGNLGILFGPLIGGALAQPASQYPSVFGNIRFFKDYPYALSSFAVGLVGLSAVFASSFIKETLKKDTKSSGEGEENGSHRPAPTSSWEVAKSPGVPIVLYVYGHVMLLAFAYTAIVPVFWFTPIHLGGFQLKPIQISLFMAITGFSQAFWLLVIFPPLQHRIGTNGVMRLCGTVYPVAMGFNVVMSLILRSGATTTFWVLGPIFLLIMPGVSMAFTGIQLALNDISPSPETLGTLNALALTISSGLRSFVPALFTSLYALGARSQFMWGYLIWFIVVILCLGVTVAVRYLPAASEKDYPDDGTREAVRQGEAEVERDDDVIR